MAEKSLQEQLDEIKAMIAQREAQEPEVGSPMHHKLEELRARRDELTGGDPNGPAVAPTPVNPQQQLDQYRERASSAIGKMQGVMVESGTIGSPEHLEALKAELELEKQLEQQQERLKQARQAAKGETPAQQLTEQLRQAGGRAGWMGVASQGIHGLQRLQSAGGQANVSDQIAQGGGAISGMLQAFPLASTAVGAVTTAMSMLAKELERGRYTLEQWSNEAGRTQDVMTRMRQTGAPTGSDIRQALTEAESAAYARAERTNNREEMDRVLRGAQQRLAPAAAREEAQAPDIALRAAQLRERLETSNRIGNWPILGGLAQNPNRQIVQQLFPGANLQAGAIPEGRMTPAQIENIVNTIAVSQGTRNRAALAAVTAARAGGGAAMPSTLPGGLSLNDLPSLFQSRQSDVLSLHDQIQQEAVKDMKQDQQFQAQMLAYERIIAAINGQPPPPVPVAPLG